MKDNLLQLLREYWIVLVGIGTIISVFGGMQNEIKNLQSDVSDIKILISEAKKGIENEHDSMNTQYSRLSNRISENRKSIKGYNELWWKSVLDHEKSHRGYNARYINKSRS